MIIKQAHSLKNKMIEQGKCTSERRSSTEAVENVGTRSDPLMIVVMKCLPDSANSQVIQAAAKENCN